MRHSGLITRVACVAVLALLFAGVASAQPEPQADSLRQAREAAEMRDQQRLLELLDDQQALESALGEAREEHAQAARENAALRIEASAQALNAATLESRQSEQDAPFAELLSALSRHSTEVRNALGDDSWLTLGDTPLPPRLDEASVLEQRHLKGVVDSLAALTRATGQASTMTLPVADAGGNISEREVVRLGDFAAFTDTALLASGNDAEHLALQPETPAEVGEWLAPYARGESRTLAVDPSRGSVLEALLQRPSLWQRFHQGGYVGYVVVTLGIIGLLVAMLQYVYLLWVSVKVSRQRRSPYALQPDNPLGRVLLRFERLDKQQTPEALEARLDEAVLAELPRLERGQPLVKLLAAIAPLLGLLGTVTGMIVTFQAITVFGTGDPQLMAGGISQALVTTVLGLVTAVPLLFAQTALSSRSRALTQGIEGRASAALASHLEAYHYPATTEAGHDAPTLA
ncbi:MotA/TolQ/ExbB proton channel family protein [Vreelandella subglaciescola]|jgi:biopolymer transport protein ExbB|uniref:Outer membrane transport energization protein ExbB n=1 Tax=Vreelandella subglaciescola TaxID=29571 RepID=A0A1M7EZ00_9GAMM|nr:MotA/TolQ/ExbB proton channel family protein [Halomonas subglaciescola]SHL97045.1 outer membrane transport energization protein ExbB [Halomonas subglaciescola]